MGIIFKNRHMKWIVLLAPLIACGPARAAPTLALGDGESLVYSVSWVVVPGAGEIRVAAQSAVDPLGGRQIRIVSTTSTRGLAYLLLPFRARAESLFGIDSGHLLWLGESSETRSRRDSHTVIFDYPRRTANYINARDPRVTVPLAMPAGDPTDLITCLLLARTWDLKPGQKHDALVLFDDDFYELTVHANGFEQLDTPFGSLKTLMLEPRMERTPPKGMFKRGSRVRVWISQDGRRLPVRFQVFFKFGSGMATLVQYTPPAP